MTNNQATFTHTAMSNTVHQYTSRIHVQLSILSIHYNIPNHQDMANHHKTVWKKITQINYTIITEKQSTSNENKGGQKHPHKVYPYHHKMTLYLHNCE